MKKIFALLLAAMMLTASGCSSEKENNDIETVEEDDRDRNDEDDDRDRDEDDADRDRNDEDEDEKDREEENDDNEDSAPDSSDTNDDDTDSEVSYDAATSHRGTIGQRMSNEFFAMTVNSASRLTTVSGYVPNNDAEYEYLCVNVKVQNNTTETINVGSYDFTVRWGNGEDDWDYAIDQEDFGFDNYPSEIDLERLKSVEGNVFFIVPINADKLYFEYIVAYDDNTTGDTYYVELEDLEYTEAPATDNIAVDNTVSYASVGEAQSTDYFDMTVNEAYTVDEVGGYYADEGYAILGVDVTLTNTTSDTISTGAYYFCTYWDDGGDDEFTYAVEEESIVDFPIYADINAGESLSGVMYFVVPVDQVLVFEYTDYYSETSWNDYRVELGSVASSPVTV